MSARTMYGMIQPQTIGRDKFERLCLGNDRVKKQKNTRYKPFAGLPPYAPEEATFNCTGKVKETPQRKGQHRRIRNRY